MTTTSGGGGNNTTSNNATTILRALRAGDSDSALVGLLAVWQRTRAWEIADLIEELSSHMKSAAEATLVNLATDAILGRLSPEAQEEALLEAWSTMAARCDPLDLGPLITRWRRRTLNDADAGIAAAGLKALMKFGDDPRLSMALANMLVARAKIPASSIEEVDTLACTHLLVLRDVRTLSVLESVGDPLADTDLSRSAARTAEQLKESLRYDAPIAVDRAWVRQLRAELPEKPKEEEPPPSDPDRRLVWELLQAVYNDPDDDAVRQVYGDAVAERGDPRGELIALGFKVAAGTARVLDQRRIDELLKEHGKMWLGSLARRFSLDEVSFEKGFISSIAIAMPIQWWKEVAEAPELRTVKVVTLSKATAELFDAVVKNPSLQRLSELRLSLDGYGRRLADYLVVRKEPMFDALPSFAFSANVISRSDVECIRRKLPRLRRLSLEWFSHRYYSQQDDRDQITPTDSSAIGGLFVMLDGLVEIALVSAVRLPGFVVSVLTHLDKVPTSVLRLEVAAGPELWHLHRSSSTSVEWEATIVARDAEFDPARIRAVLSVLPESVPLRRDLEVPSRGPSKTKKKGSRSSSAK